jgi:hypothetical protein
MHSLMFICMPFARHVRLDVAASLVFFAWPSGLVAGAIDFSRDIQPLLSDNCFACHGPDAKQRKADLRLDTRDGALADLDGVSAVVPGKPSESELVARITTDDEDDLMPPPDSGKQCRPKSTAPALDRRRRGVRFTLGIQTGRTSHAASR